MILIITITSALPLRQYLEQEVALSEDMVHKYSDMVLAKLNKTIAELRRLFLVEDLVDSIKVRRDILGPVLGLSLGLVSQNRPVPVCFRRVPFSRCCLISETNVADDGDDDVGSVAMGDVAVNRQSELNWTEVYGRDPCEVVSFDA